METDYLQEEFAGVVTRVEGLRGRNSPFEARAAARQVEGLLSDAFLSITNS